MRQKSKGYGLLIAGLVMAVAALQSTAQESGNGKGTTTVTNATAPGGGDGLNADPKPAVQSKKAHESDPNECIADLLKMLDAGVSKDVIRTFIESSPNVCYPTATEIISLKQRGLPDDLTTVLIKRGAELRTQAVNSLPAQATAASVVVPAREATRNRSGQLDPESYEYFQYYYLQPRALASAYQRMGYYGYPYNSGLYSPYGFGSYWGPGFAGPRYFGMH
jgi:hypothetical protein